MGDLEADECPPITVLDVLDVDLCARAILEHVPVEALVRSERVSRRWQRAALHYLRTCRTLSYEGFCYPCNYIDHQEVTTDHQTISIDEYTHSFPLVRKTLDKWGPYIMKVITDIGMGEYLDIIASKCPNLEQIEIIRSDCDKRRMPSLTPIKKMKQLKQIVLQHFFSHSNEKNSDLVLGELFQDIHCENIALFYNDNLTGTCFKSLKSDVLKSLTIKWCDSLRTSNMLSAIGNMRKITCLELGGNQELALTDSNLLLIQMPQLEKLTLEGNCYNKAFSKEWIHTFSQLGNLKRLFIRVNCGRLTDAFLEALARGCRNLKYLKILGCIDSITARGVTALCRRSPSARTTLHFPSWDVKDFASLFSSFEVMPLYKELAALGCVELTLEWFTAACSDPRGRELPLNPSAGCRAEHHKNSLKLIIFY